jgi:hypothetical protein
MKRSSPRDALAAVKRLAISFAFIPVAYLAGAAAHSLGVFVAVMAVGVAVSIALRVRNTFGR